MKVKRFQTLSQNLCVRSSYRNFPRAENFIPVHKAVYNVLKACGSPLGSRERESEREGVQKATGETTTAKSLQSSLSTRISALSPHLLLCLWGRLFFKGTRPCRSHLFKRGKKVRVTEVEGEGRGMEGGRKERGGLRGMLSM